MQRRTAGRFALLVSASCIGWGFWWGCSAQPAADDGTGGKSAATGGTGGAGANPTGGTGGEPLISTDAGSDVIDPLDDGSVCTATSAAAQQIQVDMVILIDRSGSMSGTKWTTVTAGLQSFIDEPSSDGLGIGLTYFPGDNASNDCVWTDYATLKVPIAALPGNRSALDGSLSTTLPTGLTPTYGALKGALFAATSYQDAHPTDKVIVIIATDGDPTSCSITNSAQIAALASQARNYNGVETYALGMAGATMANLDLIAVAGGTGAAYDLTTDLSTFGDKMAEIRSKAATCEYVIPEPPPGQVLDPGQVNVAYLPGGASESILLPNVIVASQCGNTAAWYYDDNENPTKIILCPAACETVQSDPLVSVEVLFGCLTHPA